MKTTHLIRQIAGCSKATAQAVADACKTASLNTLSESQLLALGCKETQARRLLGAFRLGERIHTAQTAADAPRVQTPVDVPKVLRDRFNIGALEQEHFWVLAMNPRQKVLDVFTVAIGSLAAVDVHPREVFKPLVRMAAHSCIIAHNHPSNDPEPSGADMFLTKRLVENGDMIGIPVLDHVIVTADGSTSLGSLGLMPHV